MNFRWIFEGRFCAYFSSQNALQKFAQNSPKIHRNFHSGFHSDFHPKIHPKIHKIGIAWAGSPTQARDRDRSCHLTQFLPLLKHPNCAFYSLQKGAAAEAQLQDLPDDIAVINLGETFNDFADTAAAIAQLDLIITIDTSVAHLAGAMGKPTWVLLCHNPDWRWGLDGDTSPWYPTMRLFRQPTFNDWNSVFAAISNALEDHF